MPTDPTHPRDALPAAPGSYVLVLRAPAAFDAVVGGLGSVHLAAGHYLYVGSALGGLRGRVGRHLRAEKRPRWHVDYVAGRAPIVEVWYTLGTERQECALAARLAEVAGTAPVEAPIGASDCACRTHLLFCAGPPPPGTLSALGLLRVPVGPAAPALPDGGAA